MCIEYKQAIGNVNRKECFGKIEYFYHSITLLIRSQNNSSCAFGFPGILSTVLKYANMISGFVSMPFSLHRAKDIHQTCIERTHNGIAGTVALDILFF